MKTFQTLILITWSTWEEIIVIYLLDANILIHSIHWGILFYNMIFNLYLIMDYCFYRNKSKKKRKIMLKADGLKRKISSSFSCSFVAYSFYFLFRFLYVKVISFLFLSHVARNFLWYWHFSSSALKIQLDRQFFAFHVYIYWNLVNFWKIIVAN